MPTALQTTLQDLTRRHVIAHGGVTGFRLVADPSGLHMTLLQHRTDGTLAASCLVDWTELHGRMPEMIEYHVDRLAEELDRLAAAA